MTLLFVTQLACPPLRVNQCISNAWVSDFIRFEFTWVLWHHWLVFRKVIRPVKTCSNQVY